MAIKDIIFLVILLGLLFLGMYKFGIGFLIGFLFGFVLAVIVVLTMYEKVEQAQALVHLAKEFMNR